MYERVKKRKELVSHNMTYLGSSHKLPIFKEKSIILLNHEKSKLWLRILY